MNFIIEKLLEKIRVCEFIKIHFTQIRWSKLGKYTGNKTSDTRCSSKEVIRKRDKRFLSFSRCSKTSDNICFSKHGNTKKGPKAL